jgi:hypothetical protein
MNDSKRHGWTTPADIRDRLRRRWQRGEILASSLTQEPLFPLRLPIKGPTSAQISSDFGAARDWIADWHNQKAIPIEWRAFSHRLFGENQMPSAVTIPDAEAAVRMIGASRGWNTYQGMISLCRDSFPELLDWLAKRAMTALDLASDWPAILAVVAWVRDHPRSGLFLRQIDAPGVHTKLVEKHRSVISELLDRVLPEDAIDASARGASGFARRYGFRDKPERIRIRFLDPSCAIAPERLGLDLTMNAAAFASLNAPVERVFITENEINFLAFPFCRASLILFGSGYGWSALAGAQWLNQREVYYWGDIDTHGFAILDQLRGHFPHVRSMLMNPETFHAFRDLHTTEPNPLTGSLQRLTPLEMETLNLLRNKTRGHGPRLEQEKIPFSWLKKALPEED